jgi:hypothetical protein
MGWFGSRKKNNCSNEADFKKAISQIKQFDVDIDVVVGFGKALEKHGIQAAKNLSHTPQEIREAIHRLEQSERIPPNLKNILPTCSSYLDILELAPVKKHIEKKEQ